MRRQPRNESNPEASPREYVVEYEGAERDDAEFQAELDERAHRLKGYVPTHREWVHRDWTGKTFWRAFLPGSKERAVLRVLFRRPKVLAITYTREDETQDR